MLYRIFTANTIHPKENAANVKKIGVIRFEINSAAMPVRTNTAPKIIQLSGERDVQTSIEKRYDAAIIKSGRLLKIST